MLIAWSIGAKRHALIVSGAEISNWNMEHWPDIIEKRPYNLRFLRKAKLRAFVLVSKNRRNLARLITQYKNIFPNISEDPTFLLQSVTPWKRKAVPSEILEKHIAGAIIRDGDRKSWDGREPIIWDNFSIFRTNCAILTSYIRADPRTCHGLSHGCCHVVWWNDETCEILLFSQRWQGIRQGRRTRARPCSFTLRFNRNGVFLRVENFFNFALWMNKNSLAG